MTIDFGHGFYVGRMPLLLTVQAKNEWKNTGFVVFCIALIKYWKNELDMLKKKWKYYILVSCFLISCNAYLQAQNAYQISGKSLLELKQEQLSEPLLFSTPIRQLSLNFISFTPQTLTQKIQALSLSKAYWEELGFFCKMEIKMEQKTRFPVKFRLGTVDYVDRLEGKYE